MGSLFEVYTLISWTKIGRRALSIFRNFLDSGQVRVEPYPNELLERFYQELGPGQPVGACFVHDGETGVIHFDPNCPLGILAPFLLHEIAHVLDSDLWKIQEIPKGSPLRKEGLLNAEIKAFEMQQAFIKELQEVVPSYTDFLKTDQARIRVLADHMNRKEIEDLYKF